MSSFKVRWIPKQPVRASRVYGASRESCLKGTCKKHPERWDFKLTKNNYYSFCKFLGEQAQYSTVLKKRYLKKQKKLKVSKLSATSAEAVTKTERNFKLYDFMTWLDQYLQMREGRTNIGTATREDDSEEYHSDTDELISNLINSKTSQKEFSNVKSVASIWKVCKLT